MLAEQLATARRRDRRILKPALAIAEQDIEAAIVNRDQAVADAKPAKTLTAQAKAGLREPARRTIPTTDVRPPA